MASLQKKKNIYYLVARVDGKNKWIRLGKVNLATAKKAAARYEVDTDYLKIDMLGACSITFREVLEQYLVYARQVKQYYTAKQEGWQLEQIAAHFGDRPLCEVKGAEYEPHIYGKGFAANTVRLRICAIRQLYKYAVGRGYIKTNVALELKKPKAEILQPRYVERKVIERIVASIPSERRLPYLVMFYTGMRPSEVLRLTTDDINMRKRTIIVRHSKTKRFRIVPIHKNLRPFLKDLPQGKLFDLHSLRSGLVSACRHMKVKVTPYQFRHTFATYALDSSRDLATVQTLLGHSTPQQTRRYATTLENRLFDVVNRL